MRVSSRIVTFGGCKRVDTRCDARARAQSLTFNECDHLQTNRLLTIHAFQSLPILAALLEIICESTSRTFVNMAVSVRKWLKWNPPGGGRIFSVEVQWRYCSYFMVWFFLHLDTFCRSHTQFLYGREHSSESAFQSTVASDILALLRKW